MAEEQDEFVWQPQPGPQQELIDSEVFEVFYGGARGGGKTDAMLGEWERHASKHEGAANGVFFRRELPQLEEAIERSKKIYGPLDAEFRESKRTWMFDSGARLKFRSLARDPDAEKYQGHSYCVAVGTPILMADGTFRAIEGVSVGDRVQTLEGQKRVLATMKPYLSRCVRAVVRTARGDFVGEQVHPETHPILTTAGLLGGRCWDRSKSGGRRHSSLPPWLSARPHSCACQETPGFDASPKDGRSGYTGFADEPREPGRLLLSSVPVVLHGPHLRSGGTFSRLPSLFREFYKLLRRLLETGPGTPSFPLGFPRLDGLFQQFAGHTALPAVRTCGPGTHESDGWRDFQITPGFRNNCRPFFRFCDGLSRLDSEVGPGGAPLQAGAAEPVRDGWFSGDKGYIHAHNPSRFVGYTHPYTKEQRPLRVPVELGFLDLYAHEDSYVCDLTVEDSNHYVTKSGLINKNTRVYFEELTNYPSPVPVDKMKATLRSAAGVPCRFRATGNPGGPGHHWVKARYIDPAPDGMEVIPDDFGLGRMFIPARLADNPILLDADPDYVGRLRQSGSEQLVRAWLDGDWDIAEGAFFDCWRAELHVLRPFRVPPAWMRFRAFDWGSARPFSVGWWAVSDGSLAAHPAGKLIRYREWYGASAPNVGLKLTAEQVADGIAERETNETMAYGVADPSIFSQDGGPSLAHRFSDRGVYWRPADNRRIPMLGHAGGWDQVRARLVGEDGKPMIGCFSTCRDSIRTIPALQHDTHRPEDVDTNGEDHAADEWRYACMSRPWVAALPAAQRSDRWDQSFERDEEASWKTV